MVSELLDQIGASDSNYLCIPCHSRAAMERMLPVLRARLSHAFEVTAARNGYHQIVLRRIEEAPNSVPVSPVASGATTTPEAAANQQRVDAGHQPMTALPNLRADR